jgi:hypothetical protein
LTREAIRDLLGKGWLTHDGMWFVHAAAGLGTEAANQLNRSAIRSMSAIEVRRLLATLGVSVDDLTDAEAVGRMLEDALAVLLPSSVTDGFRISIPGEGRVHWEWEDGECFAYKGMRRAGLLADYECGVIYRIECWLEHLGIQSETKPAIGRCLMAQGGHCAGDFMIAS